MFKKMLLLSGSFLIFGCGSGPSTNADGTSGALISGVASNGAAISSTGTKTSTAGANRFSNGCWGDNSHPITGWGTLQDSNSGWGTTYVAPSIWTPISTGNLDWGVGSVDEGGSNGNNNGNNNGNGVIGVTGTWSYTIEYSYTNPLCTQFNTNGPKQFTLVLIENSSGYVQTASGDTHGTRSGSILSLEVESDYGGPYPETWTWNGSNMITGYLTGVCAHQNTGVVEEIIHPTFTAIRN